MVCAQGENFSGVKVTMLTRVTERRAKMLEQAPADTVCLCSKGRRYFGITIACASSGVGSVLMVLQPMAARKAIETGWQSRLWFVGAAWVALLVGQCAQAL